ncbi:MAG TPA: redox-regulated ATPase YchF [Candidatus Woesearchaeota archaeon]|nr:redox-regulated ATPase YchF [Candidatus Woesearchaeota archaeon]
MAEVAIAAYPFTTIEPNEGIGFVRIDCVESFFKVKCIPKQGFCIDGQRFVPIKLLDVAGLVPGASEGKGLGNKFLDDLRQADVLIHIVDASGSTNEKGEPVPAGSYDPCNDIQFLETELNAWFSNIFKKGWAKFARQNVDNPAKTIAEQFSGLKVNLEMVKKAIIKSELKDKKLKDWTEEDVEKFSGDLRFHSKPIIIAANKIDIPAAKANIEKLKEKFPDYVIVPCSAESELALREAARHELIEYVPGDCSFEVLKSKELSEKQKKALEFVQEKILSQWGATGVQKCLNTAVFDFLKYVAVFTGGVNKLSDAEGRILPDVWLMPPDSTPVDFAEKIHKDLADKFIRAIDVKTKQVIGREYKLGHLDVISIISGK